MTKNNKKELSDKLVKSVEEMLSQKQRNGTIKNMGEEVAFLTGATVVMHLVINGEDSEELKNIPINWIISAMRGNSVNEFKYYEEVE